MVVLKLDFIDLVKKRQSVRKYSQREVETSKLKKCMEAARLAPSACNSQPWKIIILTDRDIKEQIAAETYGKVAAFNKFTHTAPVILVLVKEQPNLTSKTGAKIKGIDYTLIDLGTAAEHICLQAAELELGTCMIGWFNERPIKKILKIPRSKKIGLLICIGYPEDNKIRDKKRKPLDKITCYNKYC